MPTLSHLPGRLQRSTRRNANLYRLRCHDGRCVPIPKLKRQKVQTYSPPESTAHEPAKQQALALKDQRHAVSPPVVNSSSNCDQRTSNTGDNASDLVEAKRTPGAIEAGTVTEEKTPEYTYEEPHTTGRANMLVSEMTNRESCVR